MRSLTRYLAATVILSSLVLGLGCNPQGNPSQPVEPGKPAKLSVSGATDFGGVTIGLSQSTTLTVTNSGAGDATLDPSMNIDIEASAPFSVTGGTCQHTTVLHANSADSCTITVQFAPTVETRAYQSLTVTYTDPSIDPAKDAPLSFGMNLTGYGVLDCINYPQPQCPTPSAALSISDGPTFDYGTVTIGTTSDHTFTVSNNGRAAATLGDLSSAGLGLAAPYSVVGGSCVTGGTVAALNGSCTLVVRFAPAAVPTAYASIDVKYSSPAGNADAARPIQGAGFLDCDNYPQPQCPPPTPVLGISGNSTFNFGTVTIGLSAVTTFTVTNSGRADATLGDLSTAGLGLSGPFTVTGGTCVTGATLIKKGGNCTIEITFAPTAEPQVSQTLDIKYTGSNITGSADATVGLLGAGFLDCDNYPQPQCPPPLPHLVWTDTTPNSYGNVAVGTTLDQTYTITNIGRVDGTLTDVSDTGLGLSAPFSISGGSCATGGILTAHGGSCTLTIRFSPTDTVSSTETFSIASSGVNGSPTPLTRQIWGTGILDCMATTDFYNAYESGVSTAQTQNQTEAAQGTADGDAAAYGNGYNDGYAATYNGVYNTAYNNAYSNAYSSSYQTGYNTGLNDSTSCSNGSSAGGAAGQAAGSSAAYNDGSSNGATDGYSAGHNAGYNDGFSLGASDGNSVGASDGSSVGYNDGYNEAYGGAETNGYNAGYGDGYSAGAATCSSSGTAAAPKTRLSTRLSSVSKVFSTFSITSDLEAQCTQQGYNATYNPNSYQDAYNAAAHSGPDYQSGYTAGTSAATTDATNAGGAAGTSDGNTNGYNDGLAAGKQDEYNSCYASAYSAGYTQGYNDTYTTAYNDAYNTSYNTGYADGHGSGYTDGYNSTYSNAYNSAYATAYSNGADAGSTDGYNAGYSSGYDAGYTDGQASCSSGTAASAGPRLAKATVAKRYGSGQTWARTARNGIVVSTHVTAPIRHGVRFDASLKINARWRARETQRPKLRAKVQAKLHSPTGSSGLLP